MAHFVPRTLRLQCRLPHLHPSANKSVCLTSFPVRNSSSLFSKSLPVADVVNELRERLVKEDIPEPDLSSKYLVSQVLGGKSHRFHEKYSNDKLTDAQHRLLGQLAQCRLARMPLQYIAGNWDFRQITLQVRPPVFIPRPETEQLVDLVLKELDASSSAKILEIGPGCGNICLSLLTERQNLTVTAIDRSALAVQLTQENAINVNVDDRKSQSYTMLCVRQGTIQQSTVIEEKFDLIVSNPPYILRKDLLKLPPEISLYEDLRALDGGAEGLDTILAIIQCGLQVLDNGGKIFLEVDPCHPLILPQHLSNVFNNKVIIHSVHKDFNQVDRFLVLSKV